MKALRQETVGNHTYRIIEGIGPYMNRRYELQKKYSYYDNGRKIYSWSLICHGSKAFVEQSLHARRQNPERFNRKYSMQMGGELIW